MEQYVMEPPLYFAEDHLFDLDFHPNKDLLACTLINGWVKILSYNSDEVNDLAIFKHHLQSTRTCCFSPNGLNLATGSKDKSFSIIDTNGNLSLHLKDAHKESVNLVKFLNDDILISGDDNGDIKVWDIKSSKCVYEGNEQSEAITGVAVPENLNYLLTTSLDGTLAVYDIRKANNAKDKLYALSDCMEEDLTSIQLVKNDKFVATSTSEGIVLLFKWDWFGDCKDRIVFNANTIDHMIKLDENTLITGSEDGFVRGVSVYPNKQLQILGQHEEDENFPITKLSLSHCRKFLASLSHDNSIKFYDVSKFVNGRDQVGENTWEGYESGDEPVPRSKKEKAGNDMDDSDFEDDDSDDDSDDDDDMEDEDNKKQKKQKQKGDDGMDDEDSDDDDDSDEEVGKKKNQNQGKQQKRARLSEKAQKNVHNRNKIQNFFSDFK
ncbi:hypothetical protein ABPG72_004660 [Tetrahymena utriculariae]